MMFLWEEKKYPFNILDADVMKRFDAADKKLWGTLTEYEKENTKEGMLDADGIQKECEIIDVFVDEVFGTGTAVKMFGKGYDLGKRTKALKKLYGLKKNQLDEHNARVEKLSQLVFAADE